MKTKVVNKYHEEYDIYIGRGSIWGNPFVIGIDGDREEVIKKYREYIMRSPDLLAALPKLKGKTLGCFCKPKSCHGGILVSLIEEKPCR